MVVYIVYFKTHVPLFSQRYPTDKAYFIAKEILTTERTYLKDLEVITVVSFSGKMNGFSMEMYKIVITQTLDCINNCALKDNNEFN